WQVTTLASSRMQVTPVRVLSAIRIPGSAPCRATICAQARRRVAFTAAVILPSARSPPRAISSSVRHAVGTEATSPNSSSWSPITRKSLITSPPSAIAHARSASTWPRSCTSSRPVASAFDSPAVRPILSDSARTSVTPACDTIPVPSAVTRKPFSQPVVFTYQVLLDLGPDKDVDTLIVPGQEHFLWLPRRSAHTRREFSGLVTLYKARWLDLGKETQTEFDMTPIQRTRGAANESLVSVRFIATKPVRDMAQLAFSAHKKLPLVTADIKNGSELDAAQQRVLKSTEMLHTRMSEDLGLEMPPGDEAPSGE